MRRNSSEYRSVGALKNDTTLPLYFEHPVLKGLNLCKNCQRVKLFRSRYLKIRLYMDEKVENTLIITFCWCLALKLRDWWSKLLYLSLLIIGGYWFYRFQLKRKLATEEARRLQELDAIKSKMYTNITHDIRVKPPSELKPTQSVTSS